MTPTVKIPTIAVFDTQPPVRVFPNRRNLNRLRFDVSEDSDVAQMRPLEPRPAPVFTVPARPYSEALRGIGGQVIRTVEPYK